MLRRIHLDNRKKDMITIIAAVGICIIILTAAIDAAQRSNLQQGIAEELLRFHVLANSDDTDDQQIKYKVCDAVLTWLHTNINRVENKKYLPDRREKDAVIFFIEENLEEIRRQADAVLMASDTRYRSEASLETRYFPDREYGEMVFPAGWYQSLVIRLGKAKGHNWWCLLYPELCLGDCVRPSKEAEEQKLRSVLTAEEYNSLLDNSSGWKFIFRWLR